MQNLPYKIKELINMYTLDKIKDFEPLQKFNEICEYKPCSYSPAKLQKAKSAYLKAMTKNLKEQSTLILKEATKRDDLTRSTTHMHSVMDRFELDDVFYAFRRLHRAMFGSLGTKKGGWDKVAKRFYERMTTPEPNGTPRELASLCEFGCSYL